MKVVVGDPTPLFRAADNALQEAIGQLEEVVIIGYHKNGNEFYSSSMDDGPRALWHLERAKYKLLKIVDDNEG